ncbi:HAMP domain-containing histidine kinase [Patescibacteria group bacterium]|nr:HAMP domain-containing histidine kinase [Patescibacteria group bacterium]
MGIIIIFSILLTNFVAQKFTEPGVVAMIVIVLTAVLMVINYIIVSSFERIAYSSKQKSEFISIMSHRLRSPLSSIRWQLDLLLNKLNNLSEEQENISLEEIKKQNERMIKVVNDLLELNLIEDRGLVLTPSSFSIKDLVEELVSLQRNNAEQNGVELFVSTSDQLPNVFADKTRIKNVIYRFIDNAIKYSVNGGKITVSLNKINNQVRCSVSDEGAGISEKEIKKVFTKFFRAREVLYYQTEGSGVGLYINKAVVELSGGKTGFNSIEGRGSTFWFTLPVASSQS